MLVAMRSRPNATIFLWAVVGTCLIAFAAKSVLCRLAVRGEGMAPGAFTAVRLAAGAVALSLWSLVSPSRPRPLGIEAAERRDAWRRGVLLFAYAAPFSFAYAALDTGTGALVLFGSVQVTMLAGAVVRGERTSLRVWIGALAATAGLVLLGAPGVHAPPVAEAFLMAVAGVGWGLYSIAARRAPLDAVAFTGMAFRRAALLAVPLALLAGGTRQGDVSGSGIGLAIASGAAASACGYVAWQRLAPRLGAARAAIVQLSVPFVTAALGAIVLGETFTRRHLLAGALTAAGLVLGVRPAPSGPIVQPYGERQS